MKAVHFFEMLGCGYTVVQVVAGEHSAEQEAVWNLGQTSAIIDLLG